jgi:hypothetical protein
MSIILSVLPDTGTAKDNFGNVVTNYIGVAGLFYAEKMDL